MKIQVELEKQHKNSMFLRRSVATGHHPEHGRFEVDTIIPSECLLISFKGEKYAMSIKALVDGFFEAKSKED